MVKGIISLFIWGNDEIKETRKHPPSVPKNEHKEMEAKVVYEYPKGKFRFPLIPDEPTERRKDRTAEPLSQTSSFEKKVYRLDRQAGESRAFRPTDVPSPVFGYKRMERVERKNEDKQMVEFELPSVEKSRNKRMRECRGN
ncbi:DNA translocase SftA [Anoxybacillus sp. BCO1]|nr:DNA translocase SftA [Anoxybacillus sp. BCO1]